MRTEAEMLDLILQTAEKDDRIRVAIMNGSRANPSIPRDLFQDFDVVYFVTDVRSFKEDPGWINRFGDLMILQIPEDMQNPPPAVDGGFAYLMQFSDGNRIDLGIYPLEKIKERTRDSLTILLLDKDGLVGTLPPASEKDYLPSPPTEKSFSDCCNEFWWCCPYVAKGLWRRQIVYARSFLDCFLRAELMKMLVWYIGLKTDFSVNTGKFGKYLSKYLDPELWELLLQTYAGPDYEQTWDALQSMSDLFRKIAVPVANEFGFEYPKLDDRRVSAHLEHVRRLPEDAFEL
ncbi:MAG: aminoglycoside 6-adenylyltransferase [Anaerolineales bacterium]